MLFELTIAFEGVITVVYWAFLHSFAQKLLGTNILAILANHMMHTVPFALLCIEFVFNSIPFHVWHWIIGVIILLIYALVNFSFVWITGKTVYPIMKWTD